MKEFIRIMKIIKMSAKLVAIIILIAFFTGLIRGLTGCNS